MGEPKKNFGKLPNDYSILIKERKLSGAVQRDVLWIIMRATWGAEKRPEWASLSLTFIAEECGGIDEGNLSAELKDLTDRKIIAVQERKGCGVKRYKLTPANWKAAEKYVNMEISQPAKSAAVAEASGDTLIVRPKGSALFPARLMPAGSEPVNFQIAYSNIGSIPFQVSSSVEADIVRITFGDHKAKCEHKANIEGCLQTSVEKAKPDATIEVTRKNSFKSGCTRLLRNYFEKPFEPDTDPSDQKFLDAILQSAGADLPAGVFEYFCADEIAARRRLRKPVVSGLLIWLAGQAAKKHAAGINMIDPGEPVASSPHDDALEGITLEEIHRYDGEAGWTDMRAVAAWIQEHRPAAKEATA